MTTLSGPALMTPAVDSLSRHATAQVTPGTFASSEDGEFIYILAGGAITVSGDPVSAAAPVASGWVRGDADSGAFAGVAEAPFASGEYGYIRTKGIASVVLASGVAAGARVELSATVGQLKTITTSGDAVGVALEASDDDGDVAKQVLLY